MASIPAKPELLYPRKSVPWLGVELRARESGEAGVIVNAVSRGSPAAGVLAAADVVLRFDGKETNGPESLSTAVREAALGVPIGIVLLRGNETRLETLVLEGAPEFEDRLRLEWIGRSAPDTDRVLAIQGESASLHDYRGRVVLLEFWASFCGVCRYLAPTLDAWDRELSPAGLRVLGVTTDSPAVGSEVARDLALRYALGSDVHGEATREYHASQIPMLFVIDRRGTVRDVSVGYRAERLVAIRRLVESLLAEKVEEVGAGEASGARR